MTDTTNPTATPVLIDEETLDLSVPEPKPTAHLSLGSDQTLIREYAAYYYNGCWALDPGQILGVKLRLAEQDQLTLTFDLYCPEDPSIRYFCQSYYGQDDGWRMPLYFSSNYFGLQLDCEPLAQSFIKVTTPLLPLTSQQVGDNFIRLVSGTRLKPLFVRAVTLKRFRVQRQQQTQWCWAAVTASLMSLLDPSNQTQGGVVSKTLGADSINRPWDITEAAKKLGLAVKYTSRQLSLYELRDGINQGLPVPLQINWRKPDSEDGELGAGHYVVLTGVGPDVADENQTLIKIEDPSKGELQMTFAELKNDYPGAANKHLYQTPPSGVWTYTHRIEKKPARKVKAEKYRAPKLTTSAERQAFVRQWEQARLPQETPLERLAAVKQELARLRQMFDREIEFPGVHKGEGVQPVITWIEENEQRLRLLFEQQLRLFWVRGALTPITQAFRLSEPPVFSGAPKPPSFFDKKK